MAKLTEGEMTSAYPSLIGVCAIIRQSISVLHILGTTAEVDGQLVLSTSLVQAHDLMQICLECLSQKGHVFEQVRPTRNGGTALSVKTVQETDAV